MNRNKTFETNYCVFLDFRFLYINCFKDIPTAYLLLGKPECQHKKNFDSCDNSDWK